MPATFLGASAKRTIHAIISTRGGARSNTQPTVAGRREAPQDTNPNRIGGELKQWLKSSSKRANPWKMPCGVSSPRDPRPAFPDTGLLKHLGSQVQSPPNLLPDTGPGESGSWNTTTRC